MCFYLHLLETGQRFGEHADEMHPALHPLHQAQRNQEAQRLGGQPVSLLFPRAGPLRVKRLHSYIYMQLFCACLAVGRTHASASVLTQKQNTGSLFSFAPSPPIWLFCPCLDFFRHSENQIMWGFPPPFLGLCFSFPLFLLRSRAFGHRMFRRREPSYCPEPVVFLLWFRAQGGSLISTGIVVFTGSLSALSRAKSHCLTCDYVFRCWSGNSVCRRSGTS